MKVFYFHLKEISTSIGFYICIIFTVILLFSAEVYTDPVTQDRYSVIRAIMKFSREEMLRRFELCDFVVMQNARNGWISLFAPIITAFCFVPLICGKRDSNAIRCQIFRSTKLKFNLSRYFSGVICGGIAVSLGYAIFCGSVYFLFPHAADFVDFQTFTDTDFNFAKVMLGIFLFSAFWSMPAMFCTSVLRNKYIIMCVPLFFKYGLSQTVQRISQNVFDNLDAIDYDLLKLINIINPNGLMYLENNPNFGWILMNFGIFSLILFAGYIIMEKSRRDCGA